MSFRVTVNEPSQTPGTGGTTPAPGGGGGGGGGGPMPPAAGRDISGARVTVSGDTHYTGKPVTPDVTVTLDGRTLVRGVDYDVSFSNNTKVGEARVTVTGRGEYTGTATATFEILKACLRLDPAELRLTEGGPEGQVAVIGSKGDVVVESQDPAVASASVSGTTVTVRPGRAGETTVTVGCSGLRDGANTDASPATLRVTVVPKAAETVKTYRLYNQWSGEHLYTTDRKEWEDLKRGGWSDETDSAGLRQPAESDTPVYRLYNPWTGEHLYTCKYGEYTDLQARGWEGESVKFYSDDAETVPMYRLYNPYAEPSGMPGAAHHYTTDEDEIRGLLAAGYERDDPAWYGTR